MVKQTESDTYWAEVEAYNPSDWVPSDKLLAFRSMLQVGSPAPDMTATLLDTGESVRLNDYWRAHDVVVEFGSIT